jgi:dihydrofolate reductase
VKVSIIVAVAENGVIGRDNQLPWRLSADLRRFKALTMGHHLLLGRNTFESIGRPLPGREMIVVSRGNPALPSGVHLSASIGEAVERARSYGEEELFVAGGASIYAALLPTCDRIYMTHVHADIEGDVLFPEVDFGTWTEVSREQIPADADNEHPTSFVVYERAPSP